ncbi:DGQHR domain-containing protein [Microbacterium sp.]|uniref:DGQHR domain-containing protein n=1 Tax=Microbacterium sp. TaxID=51671 RepID=UPI0031FE5FCC|nr:DGQHR domain-containing protein [Microbacterium sp.]
MTKLSAVRVRQWLSEWDRVEFDPRQRRRKPAPEFYVTSVDASLLRRLSGIYRRSTEEGVSRSEDLGIQRRHEEDRSKEIREFVRYGYPWAELPRNKQRQDDYADLRKPGWLPGAVVVNILRPEDERLGERVAKQDLVTVTPSNGTVEIALPSGAGNKAWRPTKVAPVEVIDGQHRLWAFEPGTFEGTFEIPVVAFVGLDLSWQAYLFWTINIRPKKINRSLAFDLYPLLRTEDWLDRFEGHSIYRETRAQELTEMLWSTPESPWHHRINMLGEPGRGGVSQAAWIRALTASFVKQWEGRGTRVGGLFGAPIGKHKLVLPWSRIQQGAFLVFLWHSIREAIGERRPSWLASVSRVGAKTTDRAAGDAGIHAEHSLLGTDQGIRAVLQVANDLCWVAAAELELFDWASDGEDASRDVSVHFNSLGNQPVAGFLTEFASRLVEYDWRTAATPDLSDDERVAKLAFRGSGGYRELRRQVLRHLASGGGSVAASAARVMRILKYA